MKRAVIITVIVAMFGWAIYDYISKSNSNEAVQPEVEENEGVFSAGNDDANTNGEEEPNSDNENVNANEGNENKIKIGLERGMMAPDFELKTINGETTRLSDYRGERVLLNFWATWCPPCRAEMPDMQDFHEDTDIVILAVNLTETRNETVEKVDTFLDEYGITFPVLLDETSEVSFLYQIQPIPTNFLINRDGTIHNVAYGALNYDLMVSEYERMK